jgi:hypothetical protein
MFQISRQTANILAVNGSFNFLQRMGIDRPSELGEIGETYWLIGRCGTGDESQDRSSGHDDVAGSEDHIR